MGDTGIIVAELKPRRVHPPNFVDLFSTITGGCKKLGFNFRSIFLIFKGTWISRMHVFFYRFLNRHTLTLDMTPKHPPDMHTWIVGGKLDALGFSNLFSECKKEFSFTRYCNSPGCPLGDPWWASGPGKRRVKGVSQGVPPQNGRVCWLAGNITPRHHALLEGALTHFLKAIILWFDKNYRNWWKCWKN